MEAYMFGEASFMSSIEERDLHGTMHWYDRTVFTQMDPNFFNPDWLREKGFHHGYAKGRTRAHFLRFSGHDMVLRHFYRGGLIGRFNKDRYLRKPAKSSRAMQEFKLLVWMREQGLPVPRPLSERYVPAGLWYRMNGPEEKAGGANRQQQHCWRESRGEDTWPKALKRCEIRQRDPQMVQMLCRLWRT